MAQLLGNVTVGNIVKLNENGSPVDYLVVHQGKPSSLYDASCDGTWLLRKDIAEERVWDSGNSNVLESSDIQFYLNNTWINRYDTDIRNAIKQVKIPYRQNGGSGGTDRNGANGLSCKIFLLSGREVGFTNNENPYFPNDGSKLDYFISGNTSSAQQRRVANLNGSATDWWLRSPSTINTGYVWLVNSGGFYNSWDASNSYGVRPAMVMPISLFVQDDGVVVDVGTPALTAPTTVVQTQSISLSWSSVSGVTSYQLQRNTGSSWETIYTGPNTSYEDTAGNWSSVQYQVCALVDTIQGAYSDPQTVTIVQPSAVPTINSISTINLTESFTITWNNAANADSYVLQRNIGSGWEEVYSGVNLQYQDQALYSNMSYRVASVITDLYQSAWSSEYMVDINGQMIEMNVKNADGSYETIYPKTLIGNVVGIGDQYFTKEESLQKNVAQLYGLNGIDAIPNKAFEYLGKFNLYWWKRRADEIRYTMKVSGDSPVVLCRANTPGSVSYSDEINFNDETGAISLVSPQTATVTYVGTTDSGIAFLRGKYFSTAGKFYYASPTANYYVDRYQPNAPYGIYAGEVIAEEVNVGEVDYVYSADRDAYPDSGESGGYEYQYLGIPFENAREAPKIATGSYVGTGTSGQNNPTIITMGFEPKFLIILAQQTQSNRSQFYTALWVSGIPDWMSAINQGPESGSTSGTWVLGNASNSTQKIEVTSTGLKIISVNGAEKQLNSNGFIYYFVALG